MAESNGGFPAPSHICNLPDKEEQARTVHTGRLFSSIRGWVCAFVFRVRVRVERIRTELGATSKHLQWMRESRP
jgi:hypothetical protein